MADSRDNSSRGGDHRPREYRRGNSSISRRVLERRAGDKGGES